MNLSSLTKNDFLSRIKTGIASVNGHPNDLNCISEEDLFGIGRNLGDGGNFRRSLYSCLISPLNTFFTSINETTFLPSDPAISLDEDTISLKSIEIEVKKIYVVPANKSMMGVSDVLKLMSWAGLMPCSNAPNYLFGLFTQFTEKNAPKEIRRNLVAFEPDNPSSLFYDPVTRCKNAFLAIRNDQPANFGISSRRLGNYIDFITLNSNFNSNDVSEWSFIGQDRV